MSQKNETKLPTKERILDIDSETKNWLQLSENKLWTYDSIKLVKYMKNSTDSNFGVKLKSGCKFKCRGSDLDLN